MEPQLSPRSLLNGLSDQQPCVLNQSCIRSRSTLGRGLVPDNSSTDLTFLHTLYLVSIDTGWSAKLGQIIRSGTIGSLCISPDTWMSPLVAYHESFRLPSGSAGLSSHQVGARITFHVLITSHNSVHLLMRLVKSIAFPRGRLTRQLFLLPGLNDLTVSSIRNAANHATQYR